MLSSLGFAEFSRRLPFAPGFTSLLSPLFLAFSFLFAAAVRGRMFLVERLRRGRTTSDDPKHC
jgi:hypothetical protein